VATAGHDARLFERCNNVPSRPTYSPQSADAWDAKSCRLCTTSGLSAAAALLMRHGQVCRLCVDGSPLWSVPHRCYRAPSREQFNFRWRLPQVIGSPGLGVLSAGLSSAMSSDASYLVARRLYKRALNPTDLSGSYGTLWWRAGRRKPPLVC
jgi:hypothetical protein